MSLRLTALACLVTAAALAAGDVDRARVLYQKTDYAAARRLLASSPEAPTAAAYQLAGRCAYMEGDFKAAAEQFEKASRLEPNESSHFLWLGRAWGRRAETSNPLAAPGYASKARQNFERAVTLNPKNQEAVNDLFSYYLDAPGFLGGGLDKARNLTQQIRSNDPAEYYYALAQIAERSKDYEFAEKYLRRAAELAPKQVGRLVDLGRFLAKRGRYSESDAAFRQAESVNANSPALIFGKAQTLVESKRNLPEAKRLLETYLRLSITPDDPSREEAQKLLKAVSGA